MDGAGPGLVRTLGLGDRTPAFSWKGTSWASSTSRMASLHPPLQLLSVQLKAIGEGARGARDSSTEHGKDLLALSLFSAIGRQLLPRWTSDQKRDPGMKG